MDLRIVNNNDTPHSYVVKGAKLKCNFGDKESHLQIPVEHGIYIGDKPQANIMDFKPVANIPPFGKCRSMANPTVAAATAANHGRLRKMPCMPVIKNPWIGGKTDTLVDHAQALLEKSTNMCMWCGRITIEEDGQD